MAGVVVVITGDKKLNRALKKLPSKAQKKVFKAAARPAIKPVMQQARSNAAETKQSGQLAKSIKVRAIPRSRTQIGIRVTTQSTDFAKQFYAAFQELGWKAGQSKTPVAGTNHMRDAANTKAKSVLDDYAKRMSAEIKKAFKNP